VKTFRVVLEEPGRLEPLLLASTTNYSVALDWQRRAMFANRRVGVKVSLVTHDSADQLQVTASGRVLRDQPNFDPVGEALTIHVPTAKARMAIHDESDQ
jgi:hypothetical protein